MNKIVVFIGGIAILYAYSKTRPKVSPLYSAITDEYGNPVFEDTSYSIIDVIENAGDYILSTLTGKSGYSAMKNVDRNLLTHPNIKAFLAVIRKGEGTYDAAGYYRLFGGGTFSDCSKHPNILVSKSGYKSTAAGAFQFIKSTWDETAGAMGLTDFCPASQDIGALGRLAYRGAIDDILAGRFEDALRKTSREWASLPYSPYGQPVISYNTALEVFRINGGSLGVIV